MKEETKELYLTYLSKKAESLVELFETHYPEVKNVDSYDRENGIDVEAYYLLAKRWTERDIDGLKELYRSGDVEDIVEMFPYIYNDVLADKVTVEGAMDFSKAQKTTSY